MYRYFKLGYYREDTDTALFFCQLSSAVSHWYTVLVLAEWSAFCLLQLLFLGCWNHVFQHASTTATDLVSISVLHGLLFNTKGHLACNEFILCSSLWAEPFRFVVLRLFSTADNDRRCASITPVLSIVVEIKTHFLPMSDSSYSNSFLLSLTFFCLLYFLSYLMGLCLLPISVVLC